MTDISSRSSPAASTPPAPESTVRKASALEVEGLSWRPHGRSEPVLKDVSLTLNPGERVLLVGPSGSGKSTLLRAFSGLLDESLGEQQGSVTLAGESPTLRPGRVGLLLQDPSHAVVAEHVGRDTAFGPENRARPVPAIQEQTKNALAAVAFPYGADHRSLALSGGEMQRLSLAGALALDPEVLLLDEPTAMLDASAAATVRAAVRSACDERDLSLVVVEHRLDGWADLCDRIVVLNGQGRILADGPTAQVLADHGSDLLEAGIWVPGQAPPEPLSIRWLESPAIGGLAAGELATEDPATEDLVIGAPAIGDLAAESPAIGGLATEALVVPLRGDDPVLKVRDLTVQAPGGLPLITELDLTVNAGEAAAVIGPSGVGKSSLLHTIAGFVSATAGEILINSQGVPTPIGDLSRRPRELARSLAWLPQHVDQLLSRKTVLEEVLATSEVLFGDDPEQLDVARRRADRVMTALGIDDLRQANPYQLSGGEQRRLALASVVVHSPSIVLLDEPTVGQDRQTWAAVVGVIQALQCEGASVVAATHDAELIMSGGLDVAVDFGIQDQSRRSQQERGESLGVMGTPTMMPPGTPDYSVRGPVKPAGTPDYSVRGPVMPAGTPDYSIREVVEPDSPTAAVCNPLALMIIALGAAIGSFFVADWRVGALTLAASAVLSPLTVRKVRPALARLIPVGLAALTVGWSTLLFSDRGMLAAAAMPVAAAEVLRICCLVVPGALLVGVVRPSTLGDALAQRLHLPPRPVMAAASALLRLQQMFVLWRQLSNIRRIRGLHPGRSIPRRIRHDASMTFALLVSTLRSAQQMALSMDARGFAGARKRTFALPSPWRKRDWLCCLIGVALLFLPMGLSAVVG